MTDVELFGLLQHEVKCGTDTPDHVKDMLAYSGRRVADCSERTIVTDYGWLIKLLWEQRLLQF